MYKVLVISLFLAMLLSLFFGGHFLINDDSPSRRLLRSLTLRIILATALMVTLIYGFTTGLLG